MSEQLYNVEKILDRKKINGKFEYKIKWEGYSIDESTWEPMKNLETVKELVEEYNRTHPLPNHKSSKSSFKKNKGSLLNKKRDEENEEKNQEISQNEQILENVKNINDDEPKVNSNDNSNGKNYIIDDSLKNVVTVKQENQKLIAVVEKLDSNGELIKAFIPTEELKMTNPWILLNFYESKIKFS